MTEAANGSVTPENAPTGGAGVADAPAPTPVATAPAASPPWGTDEDFNPERAWKLIQNLKADSELKATKAAEKATADATKSIAETLGKALGIIPEDALDPVKLQAQITASDQSAKQAARELAVFKAAEGTNANALALLDSKSFLETVDVLEPNDAAGFASAITEALAANPFFAKEVSGARPALKPNPAQGGSSGDTPSLTERAAQATAKGDIKTAILLKSAGLLQQQAN